jgi:hypothetical protein
MTSNIAHRVLHIVFRGHAGCLGGFAADKRTRLYRAREIVEECEARVVLYALDGDWSSIVARRNETTERIRRLATGLLQLEGYLHTHDYIQRRYKKRLSDDRRNERRRVKPRS